MKSEDKDVEQQLHDLGIPIGQQVLELAAYREKAMPNNNNICQYGRRETKVVNVLHFINNQIWKILFGRTADGIEQSIDDEDEYRIIDTCPVTNAFISSGSDETHKKDKSADTNYGPNCANFLAGIVEGVLNASKMYCTCSAHFVPDEGEDEGNDAYSGDGVTKSKKL